MNRPIGKWKLLGHESTQSQGFGKWQEVENLSLRYRWEQRFGEDLLQFDDELPKTAMVHWFTSFVFIYVLFSSTPDKKPSYPILWLKKKSRLISNSSLFSRISFNLFPHLIPNSKDALIGRHIKSLFMSSKNITDMVRCPYFRCLNKREEYSTLTHIWQQKHAITDIDIEHGQI